MPIDLKYFLLAKELNTEYHQELIRKKLHFRGNLNSLSLISVDKNTAEKGIPNLKSKVKAEKYLTSDLNLKQPGRRTPEKELQAWIINYSMNNGGILPFGENIHYLTSEIALFENGKKIVNDILGIDDKGSLCIIELKSNRDNKVKEQTIDFEKVVLSESDFFKELVSAISEIGWNGKIRKLAVWPKAAGAMRKNDYLDVEEINYQEFNYKYCFE